jgi:hypothetical protein
MVAIMTWLVCLNSKLKISHTDAINNSKLKISHTDAIKNSKLKISHTDAINNSKLKISHTMTQILLAVISFLPLYLLCDNYLSFGHCSE